MNAWWGGCSISPHRSSGPMKSSGAILKCSRGLSRTTWLQLLRLHVRPTQQHGRTWGRQFPRKLYRRPYGRWSSKGFGWQLPSGRWG